MKQGEPRSYRRTLVVAAALSLSLVLAACTGGQDPDGNGSPTPTEPATTTSAPASPTPPQMEPPERPAAMDDDGVEGAEAAARYFLELYPYTYVTGDLSLWRAMSDQECVFCTSVIENVTSLHNSGGRSSGGDVVIESVKGRGPVEANPYYRVDIVAIQAPSVDVAGDGTREEHEGEKNLLIFAMYKDSADWTVRAVQVEDPGYEG